MLKKLVLPSAAGLAALLWYNSALAYCSEPSAPSCAARYGAFDDHWDFERCKSGMESYKYDVESFVSCNSREAQEAIDKARGENSDATSEYNDAVESFNRRARGG